MKSKNVHVKNRGFKPIVFIPIIIILLTVFVSILFLRNKKTEMKVPQTDIPFQKQGTLTFVSAVSNDTIAVIDIEVADNNQKRAQGLMYRSSLPADAGMLFIHDAEEIQSFWMKNTFIPLDMIFVNSAKEIVTIHVNTTPVSETNYISTNPALYVVEVNAGFCNQHKISVGDKIEFAIGD